MAVITDFDTKGGAIFAEFSIMQIFNA